MESEPIKGELTAACAAMGLAEPPVARLLTICLALFDEMNDVHGLTQSCRTLLLPIVCLHAHATANGPQATSRSPTPRLTQRFFGTLPPAPRRIVSAAVAAARLPKNRGPDGTPPPDRIAIRLAALVRAAGLFSRSGPLPQFRADDDGRGLELFVGSNGGRPLSPAHALALASQWNQTFDTPLTAVSCHATRLPPRPLVSPSDTPRHAAIRVLRGQMRHLATREYGLRYPADIEFVHEMRVATRRLRSTLRIFRKAFGAPGAALKAELRGMADALGDVRDSDVFIRFLKQEDEAAGEPDRPFLQQLLRTEHARRAARYRTLLQRADAPDYGTFRDHADVVLSPAALAEATVAPPAGAGPHVRDMAPKALRRILRRLGKVGRSLAARSPDTLHKLRVECKRLRYVAECLAPVYPDRLADLLDRVTTLQRLLGDVHDADVFTQRVQTFCESHGESPSAPLPATAAGLLARLEVWRSEALHEANTVWRKWRQTRDWKRTEATVRSPHPANYPVPEPLPPGGVVVDGKAYESDIIIDTAGKVRRRHKGEAKEVYGTAQKIGPLELHRICKGRPWHLIIGTGYSGTATLTPEGRDYLRLQGIAWRERRTEEAIADYTRVDQPKAALFHVS